MKFFKDIFLTKDEKKVVDYYNEINRNWKKTDSFIMAFEKLLQDMRYKQGLKISNDMLNELPNLMLVKLFERGLNNKEIIYIFSQFMVFYLIGNGVEGFTRLPDKDIMLIAKNIDKYLIPYESRVTPEIKRQIEKYVKPQEIKSENIVAGKRTRNYKREKDRVYGENLLAERLKCETYEINDVIFKELDKEVNVKEACDNIINSCRIEMDAQAEEYNIDQYDTPAGIIMMIVENYKKLIEVKEKRKKNMLYSRRLISQRLNCLESNIMKAVIRDLENKEADDKDCEIMIKNYLSEAENEALDYDMMTEDTPASIMANIINEYRKKIEVRNIKRKLPEVTDMPEDDLPF